MSRSLFGFRSAKEKIVDKIYHFFKFKENIIEDFTYNDIHYDLVIINPNGFFVFRIIEKNDDILTKEGTFTRDIEILETLKDDSNVLIKDFNITCPVFNFLVIEGKCNVDYKDNYSLEKFYDFANDLPRKISNEEIDKLYYKIKKSFVIK
jgi:hypothetical protein